MSEKKCKFLSPHLSLKNDLNYLSVSLSEMQKDKDVEKILETFDNAKAEEKGF